MGPGAGGRIEGSAWMDDGGYFWMCEVFVYSVDGIRIG